MTEQSISHKSPAIDMSLESKVQFNQLCHLFEKMSKAKTNNIRREEFLNFHSKWKDLGNGMKKENNSFYPVFRLMLPQLDKERSSYGVKEKLLAKLYVDIMGLAKNGKDAKKLLEYRNPKTNVVSTGDFAQIAFQHVLSKRCIDKSSLTIAEMNDYLDLIAKHHVDKKNAMVKKTLLEVIQKTSALEQKWLIRVLLKDMKLRLGQKAILNAFHPDAEEVYNATTSLRQVCDRLHDVNNRNLEKDIQLFQPFRPMLALNAKLDEIEELMAYKTFSIEIKYDGERSQVHKEGNHYKFFSRNGLDYSSVFGETSFKGTLTPHIHDCFSDDIISCILDGEMMGYSPVLKIFMQKGNQFDIKHITEDSDLQPCLILFDLLYLNGKQMTSTPQSKRIEILQKIVRPREGRLQLAESRQAISNHEVVNYLNEAIDRREEGIIIKNPLSVYAPNKRKGSGWFKVKPEYAGGVVDDLDLVIIGGSFGSGRRGNFLSMFFLGVGIRDPANPSKPPQKYKSFCRVGSGYTDSQLLKIIDKIKPNLKVFEKKSPPEWLEVTKERPEVCIHPKQSLVVQVRASEIITSSSYATGCTLRFPRIVSIRTDKTYIDALDFDGLHDLKNICDGKLAARHAQLSTVKEPPHKKRRVKFDAPVTVAAKFQGADLSTVIQVSNSFQNKTFCVISGTSSHNKLTFERQIAEHGGAIVQNPTADIYCIVARDGENVRVRNAVRSGKYDIIKADWLIRCLENGVMLPWKPSDMIFASNKTLELFKENYDQYGDEYDKDVTSESLKDIFSKISKESSELLQEDMNDRSSAMHHFSNSIIKRYESYGFADLSTSLLSQFRIYVHPSSASYTATKSLVQFYGAFLCGSIVDDVSHVIAASSACKAELEEVFTARRQRKVKFHFTDEKWLLDSVREGRVMNENDYALSF